MAALYTVFYGVLGILNLLAAVAAVIVSIIARKQHPKRATYAMIGFGLFAFAGILSFVWPLLTGALLTGPDSFDTYRALSLANNVLQTLLSIAAIGMLLLALFRSDETASPSPGQYAPQQQQQQQQYPGQQPPQQQYPGQPQQQYPYQQQPPQQQPPPQQYPGQQYPGQQYPGQGGQQYPGQGY